MVKVIHAPSRGQHPPEKKIEEGDRLENDAYWNKGGELIQKEGGGEEFSGRNKVLMMFFCYIYNIYSTNCI